MKEKLFERLVKPFLAERKKAVGQYQNSVIQVVMLFLIVGFYHPCFEVVRF